MSTQELMDELQGEYQKKYKADFGVLTSFLGVNVDRGTGSESWYGEDASETCGGVTCGEVDP